MKNITKTFGVMVLIAMLVAACAPTATPTEAPTMAPTEVPATMAPTEAPATMAPTEMPVSAIDCMGAKAGDSLSLVYEWTGAEETALNTVLKPFVDACGVTITPTETRDIAVLDTMVKSTPPDVVMWPDLRPLKLYTDMLQPLDTVGADQSNYPAFWVDFGTMNGKWLTIPVKADYKSIIWYSPAQFQAFGYQVPTTLDELKSLVDQMVADGNVPWSMGFNNGGSADGWTGTDFIQDLLLTTQGPAYVSGIVDGSVPYNDQAVVDAYTLYYKWASDPKYTVGGADGTVNTAFADAILQVFSNPPKAMMVKQSGFAGGNIASAYPDLKYGTDYDFFQFPGIQGAQGGADFLMDFNPTPAAKALIAYLTSALGGQNWAAAGFGITPNTGGTGYYTDPVTAKLSDLLNNSNGFTFDLGDGLGDPFATAEFKGVVDIVQGADIMTTLNTVAAAQAQTVSP